VACVGMYGACTLEVRIPLYNIKCAPCSLTSCVVLQDVYPNSPASAAGLEARSDYIVGTPEIVFNDSEDFFTLINAHNGKPLQLYVYNINSDSIRLVSPWHRRLACELCLACI
jgi:hypothetical protein